MLTRRRSLSVAIALLAIAALGACGKARGLATSPCETLPERAQVSEEYEWQQLVMERDLVKVDLYTAKFPETFAGSWLDNHSQKIRVAFVGPIEHHDAALRPQLEYPDLLALQQARYTEAELNALQDVITGDLKELTSQGHEINSVGRDPIVNRVVVGMSEIDDDTVKALEERYGCERIAVEKFGPQSAL